MYNELKLNKIDVELLENHNNTIERVENEKKQEIHIFIENDIRKVRNLINDDSFILNYCNTNNTLDHARLMMFNLVNNDLLKTSKEIDLFIDKKSIFLAKRAYINFIDKLKKQYLFDLKNIKAIKI